MQPDVVVVDRNEGEVCSKMWTVVNLFQWTSIWQDKKEQEKVEKYQALATKCTGSERR